MKLIATRDFTYATRKLRAGDEFEATAPVGRALIGVRKARAAEPPAPPPEPEPQSVDDERERLRDEAADLGIEVDGRWGVDRLRDEIAGALARSVLRHTEPADGEPAEPEAKPE